MLGWDEVLTEEELSVTLKVRMARWGKSYTRRAQSAAGQTSSAEWLSEGDKHLKAVGQLTVLSEQWEEVWLPSSQVLLNHLPLLK